MRRDGCGVGSGVGVRVGLGDGVGVGVIVGVGVGVFPKVGRGGVVARAVGVLVGPAVGRAVWRGVLIGVGVGVLVETTTIGGRVGVGVGCKTAGRFSVPANTQRPVGMPTTPTSASSPMSREMQLFTRGRLRTERADACAVGAFTLDESPPVGAAWTLS